MHSPTYKQRKVIQPNSRWLIVGIGVEGALDHLVCNRANVLEHVPDPSVNLGMVVVHDQMVVKFLRT